MRFEDDGRKRGIAMPQFDHEKLDVYKLELVFVSWATDLIADVKKGAEVSVREPCDHLDRASLSILFNTAEGNGKRQTRTRAKFFGIARGSATECAACLDALVAKKACSNERIAEGKGLLVRIVSMLTKLVERFGNIGSVREDDPEYIVNGE
jgi:four helix bundle protein